MRSATCSTRPRCTTRTSSSARAASGGSPTTCSGSRPTRSCVPRRAVAGLRPRGLRGRAGASTRRAGGASAGADGGARAAPTCRRASSPRCRRSRSRSHRRRGRLVFAAGAALLGVVCLHELYRCTRGRARRLAGSSAAVGLALAAQAGGMHRCCSSLVASCPLMFLVALAMPRATDGGHGVTTLGVVWIGIPLAHAVLLRDLPHGARSWSTSSSAPSSATPAPTRRPHRSARRPLAPRISPNKTIEGLVGGFLVGGRWRLVRRPLPGLALGGGRADPGPRRRRSRRRSATSSSRCSSATLGTKDTGRLFGPHGGVLDRLDARSSRSSSATTCGLRSRDDLRLGPLPDWMGHEAAAHPRLDRLDRHAGARRRRARSERVRGRRPGRRRALGARWSSRRASTACARDRARRPATPPRAPPRRGPAARCWPATRGSCGWSPSPAPTSCSTRSSARPASGPTIVALTEGIDLALANKETLVVGGELVMALAEATGAQLLPVDSEHSALYQLLTGEPPGRRSSGSSSPPPAARSAAARDDSRTSPSRRRSRTRPGRWAARSRSTRRR